MKINTFPRVLVISNNCFSLSESNGRTLGSIFYGWHKEKLAQVFINAKDPNWDLCINYYCIEDKVVLNSFLHMKKAKGRTLNQEQVVAKNDTVRPKTGVKTVAKILCRQLIWSANRWDSLEFKKWINEFSPDLILCQFGDAPFMLKMARTIAKRRNIPLTTFNTEGYYFFNKNCFNHTWTDFICFPLFQWIYRREVRKFYNMVRYAIYCNSLLQNDYSLEFPTQSSVIYTGSEIAFQPKSIDPYDVRFSYLGNLGLDRDSGLIEIGKVLQSLNPDYYVDIYGNANKKIAKKLENAIGIRFHGLVDYNKVKEVIAQSDVLFHVETEKGIKERSLQYGFSTKIADSVSSGKCFVLYAPLNMASTKYILDTGAGWYAQNTTDLAYIIKEIIYDAESRNQILEYSRTTASENHNTKKNAQTFQKILKSIVNINNT